MQFLASFHIVLTCSFVVLLAYLLSRVFTYLAHSVIHGSRRTRGEGSSRSRRSGSLIKPLIVQDEAFDGGVMARLQEEDEDDDDDNDATAYEEAVQVRMVVPGAASEYDMAGGIFDAEIDEEYEVNGDGDVKAVGAWDNEEGLGAAINGRYADAAGDMTVLDEYKDGDAGGNGLLEKTEEKGGGNGSALRDAQGSGSVVLQRLPPTWSDLEQMVKLSSKKHAPPPSVSPVPEY